MGNYKTLNPANGKLLLEIPEISDKQAQQALDTAHNCFKNDWSTRTVADRAQIVTKAANILRERVDDFARLATLEMGKLINESRDEVKLSADILEYYATHAEAFMQKQHIPQVPGSVVLTQPLGVILGIEPWNFPYYQLARIAGPQLMTGNVLIVKDARNIPQCTEAFARLFREAGAPEGVYTNVLCSFDHVNSYIDDFRVRGVTLTGSESSGAKVAERAGRALKKVVLELGGSDPFIVLEDADLEHAVSMAVKGRLRVMGQECTSSKRFIIVGKERGRRFQEGLTQAFKNLKAGDPMDSSTTLGPVTSESALNTLLEQIDAAKKHGARVVYGGKRMTNFSGYYLEPTIITDITEKNPIYHEETFGPIASVYVVDNEDEAVKLANATKFGLGSSVFGKDTAHAQEIAAKVESGMVFINSTPTFAPELPFGGVKNSGFGRELGEHGFGEFVNRKLVRTV